jgi:NitT/TauT family transport system substrate-binding protein
MPNYGSLWAVTTAIEKGYFAEAGIEVNLVEFADGPTIIAAMENGSIDMGYIGQGAHKLCIQGNANIFALSHISNGDAVIGGANVKSLEDLKGKTVAYSSGTSSEDILKNGLAKAGLTMDDIKAMDMDPSNIVTAMLSGGVDACSTWSPNSLKIMDELQGATKLADNLMFADSSVSLASWIVTSKYADANSAKILAFTKALYKAMDYAADGNYDEVAGYVSNQTKTDKAVAYAQRGDADWLTGKDVAAGAADGTVEAYYKTQQKGFLASGAVTAEVPVADYVMLQNMIDAGK